MMNKRERNIHLTKQDKASLESTRNLLSNNPGQRMTIVQLANQTGMNRSKLTAGFKQLTGKSVHRFILDVRMNYAKKLLSEKELPIKTIAGLCSYSNIQSFTKVFKKYWQETTFGFSKKMIKAHLTIVKALPFGQILLSIGQLFYLVKGCILFYL